MPSCLSAPANRPRRIPPWPLYQLVPPDEKPFPAAAARESVQSLAVAHPDISRCRSTLAHPHLDTAYDTRAAQAKAALAQGA